ncbi:MAG: tyrosine-type recombinase/integrase [Tannerella sp.]|jgi:site-specific recombinase XerD|nr:tyrosine-type recombinase/integrase [Tannerella sp.]
MEKNSKNIGVLIKLCENHLRKLGYSQSCIELHLRKWQQGIKRYMDENGISEYNRDVGEQYLRIATKGQAASTVRCKVRNIHILTEYIECTTISKRIVPLVSYPLHGEIGAVANLFLQEMQSSRRCDLTVQEHRRMLSYFIAGLSLKSKSKIKEITERDILDFIDSAQHCKDKHFNTMRLFFRFLYEHKHITGNMEYILGRNNFPKREKLPSVYTSEEIKQVEESVDSASPAGKRDYAILLLASRLGLRASDICGLQFSNIDWDKNIIRLTQYKTQREIELPLLTDIGEAIINYLRYGRPVSDLPQIFLTATAPYRVLNHIGMNGIVSRIMKNSGVNINNRKFGPHSMRHSLASQLLKNGISLPVISETLGHEKTQTTMEYLRIDLDNLLKCTLDVPLVNPEFYERKGGIFYE